MQPVIAKFSERQVRLAVLAVLIEALGKWRFFGIAVLLALLLFAAAALQVLPAPQAIGGGAGLAIGVAMFLVILALLYFVNLRFTMRAFQSLSTREVRYSFSEEGCAVSSDKANLVLPWHSVARALRYPSVWLLEIKTSRPKRDIVQSFRRSLKETQSVAAAQAEFPSFPILWALPVPLRCFLVIPTKDLDDRGVSFVRRMVETYSPDRSNTQRSDSKREGLRIA